MRPHKKQSRALALIPAAPLVIPAGGSARLTFLEQLRVARGRIDEAIAAVEGLA